MTAKRLSRALSHAESIEALIPKPQPKRTRKILLSLSDAEHQALADFAAGRELPLATAVRSLALAALVTVDAAE